MLNIRYNTLVALIFFISATAFAYDAKESDPDSDSKKQEKTYEVCYGVRDKDFLTGAVSTIYSKQIDSSPETGIDKILKGRLTGLSVISGGDEPGNSFSTFYIRGTGTYGQGQSPLVMIDGIEGSYALLHPEEIESVTVLKDAASLALYGIRAANGVIQFKTKRGYKGVPKITIKAQAAALSPTRMPQYLGSQEYLSYRNIALQNDGLSLSHDPRLDPNMYNGTNDQYLYPNTDWYSAMLKSLSLQQNYTASISGGSDKVRYYVFAGLNSQDGLFNNTDLSYTSINLRANLDINITDNFSVKMDLSTNIEERKTPLTSADDLFSALSTFPSYLPLVNRNGTLAGTSEYSNNPMALVSKTGYGNQNSRYLIGNVKANYNFTKKAEGLSIYAQYSFNTYKHFGRKKSQSFALFRENLDGTYSQYGQDTELSLEYERMQDDYALYMAFIGGLEYKREFGKNYFSGSLNALVSSREFTGNNPNNKQINFFGHFAYAYDRRYVVELGSSYSGSEDFINENRYGFFPTISAAWNISNEKFIEKSSVVSNLKLRGSFGVLGNADIGIGRFPSDPRYYIGAGYYFGGSTTESDGAYEGSISNPNVTFEKSYSANIGVDFGLLKNTLYGSLDLFNDNRVNIISQRTSTKPAIIGQVLPFENYGSVNSRGIEVMLGYRNNVGNFNYEIEANVSYARNCITLYDEVSGLNPWESRVGKSVTQLWGHQVEGIYNSQSDIDNHVYSIYSNLYPGDLKYNNINDDDRIDDSDKQPIGAPTVPELNCGLNLSLEYKGFEFSVLFSGVANRSVYVNNNVLWGGTKMTKTVKNAWQSGVNEGTATLPRLTTLSNEHNYRENSLWIMNADYLRLQNVEIGYNFPKQLTRKAKIENVKVFVNGSNLLSIDALSKFGLNAEDPSLGVTSYPQVRIMNLGLSLQF